MSRYIVVILIFYIFGVCDAANEAKTVNINNTNAKEGEFPYAVSLRRNTSHICGGTILKEKFILTAGHCVCNETGPKYSSDLSIQYDMLKITKKPINAIDVKEIHCNINPTTKQFLSDVAVLELKTAIPKGKWVPVKISNKFVADKTLKTSAIGWGRMDDNGPVYKTLQKLEGEVFDDATCKKNKYDIVQHVCVGPPMGGVCRGDSGSPLIVNGIQVGIASFVTDTCETANKEHPNIFFRVASSYDWIAKIAGL